MSTLVVTVFLFFFTLELGVETALLLLNLRHVRLAGDGVPLPLQGHITPETAQRSVAYTLANGRFSLVQGLYGAGITLLALFSGVLPALSDRLVGRGWAGAHLFVAFLVCLFALLSLVNLPFGAYHTFAIETRFGFNRMGWGLWLLDRGKALLLAAVLGIPLLYGVYWFMSLSGRWWWLWLFGFLVVVQAVILWLYPTFIAPCFNKFAPLPEGELKQRLEALARATGFRNRGLFVMDASRRSGHSNAYFTGLVRPRIVLFDTLIKQMSVDETVAVLAHEIGHYKGRHIQRHLAWSLGATLLALFVLSRLIAWPPLFEAFGFSGPSNHAALAIFSLTSGAFTFFFAPLAAWRSRRDERSADRFSVEHTGVPQALKTALIRLGGENLSNLNPHPWYSRWHYSHPTLLERIADIDRLSECGPGAGACR